MDETPIEAELKWNIEVPQESIKNSSRLKILLDADLLELTIEVRFFELSNYFY